MKAEQQVPKVESEAHSLVKNNFWREKSGPTVSHAYYLRTH